MSKRFCNSRSPATTTKQIGQTNRARIRTKKKTKENGFDNEGLALQNSFLRVNETTAPCSQRNAASMPLAATETRTAKEDTFRARFQDNASHQYVDSHLGR